MNKLSILSAHTEHCTNATFGLELLKRPMKYQLCRLCQAHVLHLKNMVQCSQSITSDTAILKAILNTLVILTSQYSYYEL